MTDEFLNSVNEIKKEFNNNGVYPSLATKQDSCENPELSYHINRMLRTYLENKDILNTDFFGGNIGKNNSIYDRLIRDAIIFHDLGKLNYFFQWRMIKDSNSRSKRIKFNKKWSFHSRFSCLLAYLYSCFLTTQIKNSTANISELEEILLDNYSFILISTIAYHHSSLNRLDSVHPFQNYNLCKKDYLKEVKYYFEYLQHSLERVNLALDKNLILDYEFYNDYFSNELLEKLFSNSNILLEGFKDFLNDSYSLINKKNKDKKKKEKLFFLIVHVASILTSLDKWDAKTSRSSIQTIRSIAFDRDAKETFIKNNPFRLLSDYLSRSKKISNLNATRDTFLKEIIKKTKNTELNKIYTITAPCGIGKTLAILNMAFQLRQDFHSKYGFFPKIIYALPFISICDQLEQIIKTIFNCESQTDFLIIHHYLAEIEKFSQSDRNMNCNDFKELSTEDESIPDATGNNKSSYLNSYEIRNWHSEIIITTTIKLFNTMLNYNKGNLVRFNKLVNTIIIIDEYHSIPKKYQDIIRKVLITFSQMFNTTFILATATTPALFYFKDYENNVVNELVAEIDNENFKYPDYFKKINRYKIRLHKSEYSMEQFQDFIKNSLRENKDKNVMIVVNTRKLARKTYEFLNDLNQHTDKDIINNRKLYHLSTNIIPYYRKGILNEIDDILKNEKVDSSQSNEKIILITTQLIEAGIDISFQKIIRDLGPLYSIVQVAGRCNRNSEIIEEEKLPIIDIINVENSHKKVYDSTDIEVTQRFFINNMTSRSGKFIEMSEREIRKNFHVYANLLDEQRNRDEGYKEFYDLNFKYFNRKFKLIEELPVTPIIVIPDSKSKSVRNLRALITKIQDQEFGYFPQKLYSFMIGVYKNSLGVIESNDKIFEKITIGSLTFYLLDLNKDEALKYHDPSLGFLL
ncbi:MAG: CRISPR-associated helicase Cas3' [Candidatus Helarchaeota archaeon]